MTGFRERGDWRYQERMVQKLLSLGEQSSLAPAEVIFRPQDRLDWVILQIVVSRFNREEGSNIKIEKRPALSKGEVVLAVVGECDEAERINTLIEISGRARAAVETEKSRLGVDTKLDTQKIILGEIDAVLSHGKVA